MEHFRPAHFARLKHLAVFAVVVDSSSFTTAGKRLGIAKSAVSRYVSELEDELGVALLRRTTRKVVPTEAGERVFADCARFVESVVDSFDAVEPDTHLLGSLHLGATYAFGQHVVLPAVQGFAMQNPGLSIQMSLNDRLVDLVTHGIDLSFRIGSPGDVPSYISRRIGAMRFKLYASRKFLANHDASTPRKVERLPWLLNPLKKDPDSWVLCRGKRRWTLKVASRLISDSTEVAVQAAQLGMGIVGIPDFMCSGPVTTSLVEVLPAYRVEPELSVFAVYPRRRFLSPRVSGFLAHLEGLWPGPPSA